MHIYTHHHHHHCRRHPGMDRSQDGREQKSAVAQSLQLFTPHGGARVAQRSLQHFHIQGQNAERKLLPRVMQEVVCIGQRRRDTSLETTCLTHLSSNGPLHAQHRSGPVTAFLSWIPVLQSGNSGQHLQKAMAWAFPWCPTLSQHWGVWLHKQGAVQSTLGSLSGETTQVHLQGQNL